MTATTPITISLHIINHVALYMTKKAVNYKTTLKKNKKSLKLSSGLSIKINLVNLTNYLINDLINTL